MKKLLISLCILVSSMSYAASKNEVPSIHPFLEVVWLPSINLDGVTVYPQKDLFDMEGVRYKAPSIEGVDKGKYHVWNSTIKPDMPVINKLRVSSGKAPISLHDNEFVRLCRLNGSQKEYYEMSATQANRLSEVSGANFDPSEDCVLGGKTALYWKARYMMFYDKYGNKRGVR